MEASPPPLLAATVSSRLSLVNMFPRSASCLPFRIRMFFHLLWPAIHVHFGTGWNQGECEVNAEVPIGVRRRVFEVKNG